MMIPCPILLLLLVYSLALARATTSTATRTTFFSYTSHQHHRNLQVEDWHINLVSDSAQSLQFNVGDAGGSSPSIVVDVYDECPSTSTGTPTLQGELYPSNTVTGLETGGSTSIALGTTSTLAWAFEEGMDENTDLFTDTGSNTGSVALCLQIGLYDDTPTLLSYLEVDLAYTTTLEEDYSSMSGYSKTAAETEGLNSVNMANDGTLQAYFCNPSTHVQLPNDSSMDHQGLTLDVCFQVSGGQFQVESVYDLTIQNDDTGAGTPDQPLIVDGVLQQSGSSAVDCTTTSGMCVVSFKPAHQFFDYDAITLAGSGSVIVQLGGRRTRLRRGLQPEEEEEEEERAFAMLAGQRFIVQPQGFEVHSSSASSSSSCSYSTLLWRMTVPLLSTVGLLLAT